MNWGPSPARSAAILVILCVASEPAFAAPQLVVSQTSRSGSRTLQTLPPGAGLIQATVGDRVLSRVVDPAAPVRLIVELDAEPRATAPRAGADPALALRALDVLRAGVARLGGTPAAGGLAPRAAITHEYHEVFCGAALTVAPELVERVRALPGVRRVFLDDSVHATLTATVPLIGADKVRIQLGGTGAGIRVGIIDTGIDYDNPAFGGGFGPGHRVRGGWDYVNQDPDPRDDNGHGTHVAGIVGGNGGGVLGVAPQVTFYAFKVLNSYGSGWGSDILMALERVLDPDQNPATDDTLDVINLSLGAQGTPDDPMSIALDRLTELGVVCTVAAGNDGGYFTIGSPGTSRKAITVGATTKSDYLTYYSSRGPASGPELDLKPDLVAPGDGVVSASLGTGTAQMSGTSMAAPHVAGVAAQLRQLHPGWSAERVKSVITGTAKDLGYNVWEQGAGRLDAWAAANATFELAPGHLSFGRIDGETPTWTAHATVTVSNLTPDARTVSFAADGEPPQDSIRIAATNGITITVTPATVDLPPSGSATVDVAVTVDNTIVPYPSQQPLGFGGTLIATSDTRTQRLPWSLHKAASLRVNTFGSGWVIVHDRRFHGYANALFSDGDLLLTPGHYDVMFASWTAGFYVVREDVDVTGNRVIQIDPAEANLDVEFHNVDARGVPVTDCRTSLSIVHDVSKMGFNYIGFPIDRTSLSRLSTDYLFEWARASSNGRDRRISFAGALRGVSESSVQTNLPTDLHHVVFHLPKVVPSAAPLIFELDPFRVDDGYFGFAFFDTTMVPLTAPSTFDWWLQPSPYAGHFQLGLQFEEYPWEHGYLNDFSNPAMYLPVLRLDHGWPIEGYVTWLFEPRAFLFGGEHMRFGEGPPVWRGTFLNGWNAMSLSNGPPLYSMHLESDMYGAKRRDADVAFTITAGGPPIVRDSLHTGSLAYQPALNLAVPTPFSFHTRHAYSLQGTPASLQVDADMTLQIGDPNPPSLRILQVYSDGEATADLAFATSEDAGIRFQLTDDDPAATAELRLRAVGSPDWIPLTLGHHADEWVAQIPPTLDGPVSMQLIAHDPGSNRVTLTWDRAFVAHAANVTITPLAFEARPGLAQVQWKVNGAGLRFGVERREGGSWAGVGRSISDAGGVVAFADSSVVGGARYGYRLVLARGGIPLYSNEVVIQVPASVSFEFAGAWPNPTAGDLNVRFSLPDATEARLEVLDVTGRMIASREVGSLGAGTHFLNLSADRSWKPGVYFIRLRRAGETRVARVAFLK